MRNKAQWRAACSPKGKQGRGGVGDDPSLQGALWLPHRCWLTACRAPERWAVQTLKHQRNRPWGKSFSLRKQVPAKLWTGLTGHEQLRRADTLLQGPHLQGQSSASRAMAAGSLHVHRCTGNTGSPSLQTGLSPGSAWGGECAVSGEEAQENPEEAKPPPNP